jgi:hypothetical protein
MTRQRNGYGARVGASGFLLTDDAPDSANVGRKPKRDGNVVLVFQCASCDYWAGDVGLPIGQPESVDLLSGAYAEGKTVDWLELDGKPQGAIWARCVRCKGKAGQPREVVLRLAKIIAALQELRRLHLEQQVSPIAVRRF